MAKLLRAAVIGAGTMGQNHARVYSEMDDVELVAVADPVPEALSRMAQRHRVRVYGDYRAMLEREQLDMVTIAVPTQEHCAVATDVVSAQIPALVEKPIAATVQDARALLALAREAGVMLTIGHIERFNPAILALKSQLAQGMLGKIYQIHVRRLSPFPPRIKDVGVVVDLATHDLDIIRYLTNADVVRLHAEIGRRLHTAHEDMLSAILRLDNEVVGVLDINWLTPTKVRELSVIGERGMFVVSYLTQELVLYENEAAPQGNDWQQLAVMGVSEGRSIRYKINKREPLREELEAFALAVRTCGEPPVRGEDGLLALALAQKIIEAGSNGGTMLLEEKQRSEWLPVIPADASRSELARTPVVAGNGHG